MSCLLVVIGEMPQGTYGRVQEVRVAAIPPHNVNQSLERGIRVTADSNSKE